MFMATVGLVFSVVSGVFYVNVAVRMGWVKRAESREPPLANGIRALNAPGSMYFMLDVREIATDTKRFAFDLLAQENLCIMPGESFGPSAAGHLRVSLCQREEQLVEAATRLRRFASNYNEKE